MNTQVEEKVLTEEKREATRNLLEVINERASKVRSESMLYKVADALEMINWLEDKKAPRMSV